MTPANETWSSRYGFILATIGSAIGIGSIWKFPYEVGANGGGAFVFVYALGLLLVVVPLMGISINPLEFWSSKAAPETL